MSAHAEATREGRRSGPAAWIGIIGIGLGILAFWIALPPLAVRTAFLPIVVGAMGRSSAWAR